MVFARIALLMIIAGGAWATPSPYVDVRLVVLSIHDSTMHYVRIEQQGLGNHYASDEQVDLVVRSVEGPVLQRIPLRHTARRDTTANNTWKSIHTIGECFSLEEYMIRSELSYAFPMEWPRRDLIDYEILPEGIFLSGPGPVGQRISLMAPEEVDRYMRIVLRSNWSDSEPLNYSSLQSKYSSNQLLDVYWTRGFDVLLIRLRSGDGDVECLVPVPRDRIKKARAILEELGEEEKRSVK